LLNNIEIEIGIEKEDTKVDLEAEVDLEVDQGEEELREEIGDQGLDLIDHMIGKGEEALVRRNREEDRKLIRRDLNIVKVRREIRRLKLRIITK
jgi:hypothetical protein